MAFQTLPKEITNSLIEARKDAEQVPSSAEHVAEMVVEQSVGAVPASSAEMPAPLAVNPAETTPVDAAPGAPTALTAVKAAPEGVLPQPGSGDPGLPPAA